MILNIIRFSERNRIICRIDKFIRCIYNNRWHTFVFHFDANAYPSPPLFMDCEETAFGFLFSSSLYFLELIQSLSSINVDLWSEMTGE